MVQSSSEAALCCCCGWQLLACNTLCRNLYYWYHPSSFTLDIGVVCPSACPAVTVQSHSLSCSHKIIQSRFGGTSGAPQSISWVPKTSLGGHCTDWLYSLVHQPADLRGRCFSPMSSGKLSCFKHCLFCLVLLPCTAGSVFSITSLGSEMIWYFFFSCHFKLIACVILKMQVYFCCGWL